MSEQIDLMILWERKNKDKILRLFSHILKNSISWKKIIIHYFKNACTLSVHIHIKIIMMHMHLQIKRKISSRVSQIMKKYTTFKSTFIQREWGAIRLIHSFYGHIPLVFRIIYRLIPYSLRFLNNYLFK